MTPRPLLLVGAGGLAREVLAAVRLQPSEWKPIGALDDDPSKHGADLDSVPVLGGSEVAGELTDAAVVVCMAHARRPTGRLCFARRLAPRSGRSAPAGASRGRSWLILVRRDGQDRIGAAGAQRPQQPCHDKHEVVFAWQDLKTARATRLIRLARGAEGAACRRCGGT